PIDRPTGIGKGPRIARMTGRENEFPIRVIGEIRGRNPSPSRSSAPRLRAPESRAPDPWSLSSNNLERRANARARGYPCSRAGPGACCRSGNGLPKRREEWEMKIRRAGAGVVAAVGAGLLALAAAPAARAQVKLEYKFPEGQTLTYKTNVKINQVMTIMGMEIPTEVEETVGPSRENGKRATESALPLPEKDGPAR